MAWTAATRIDAAIRLSTVRLGMLTRPNAARARVIECPTGERGDHV
jgi:hypothetical protein